VKFEAVRFYSAVDSDYGLLATTSIRLDCSGLALLFCEKDDAGDACGSDLLDHDLNICISGSQVDRNVDFLFRTFDQRGESGQASVGAELSTN
jgi:hypothetical protein